MNKFICLVFVLLVATQCAKEDATPVKPDYKVPMSFDVNGAKQVVNVNFSFDKVKQRYVPTNSNVIEMLAIHKETNKTIFVYLLTQSTTDGGRTERVPYSDGYFYDGSSCYIWGRMWYGDNGQNLFVPGNSAYNPPMCGYYYA